MRLYACWTPSHEQMMREYFLPSRPLEFGLENTVLRELPQESATGEFDSAGFRATCARKLDFVLGAIAAETEPFLFSDVDVRFYGPVVDDLLVQLGDADIAFQNDGPGGYCTGFFVARPNERTGDLFRLARKLMDEVGMLDQPAVNLALKRMPEVRRKMLTSKYWTFGRSGKHWEPMLPVDPPAALLVHHANWTTGVANKMALLESVKMVQADRADEAGAELRARLSSDGFVGTAIPSEVEALDAGARAQEMIERHALGATAGAARLLEQQRARLLSRHHPMPMALVLQFWMGDKRRAIELAHLLTDIEPEPREDVLFVFARQSNCLLDRELRDGMSHVGQKFDVMDLETSVDESKRYPGICYDPWASAAKQISDMYYGGRISHHSVFFFEPDGCPLRSTWIDDLKSAHAETLLLGKRVTGPHMRYGDHDHVNGTLAMHLSCWEDHPSLHRCPPAMAWDVFAGPVLVNEAGPSQIIRNEHGMQGVTKNQFWILAKESAWLTSVKDGTPQHWARREFVRS